MPERFEGIGSRRLSFSAKITSQDLRQGWDKFDEIEVAAIRTTVDLVMQVQAKYGLDKQQARAAVEVWANGRGF